MKRIKMLRKVRGGAHNYLPDRVYDVADKQASRWEKSGCCVIVGEAGKDLRAPRRKQDAMTTARSPVTENAAKRRGAVKRE